MTVEGRILKLLPTTIDKALKRRPRNTRQSTEPSKLLCRLKDVGHIPINKWFFDCNAKPYSSGAIHSQRCLAEKLAILWTAQTRQNLDSWLSAGTAKKSVNNNQFLIKTFLVLICSLTYFELSI